jgi:sulfur carrier protein
LCFFIFKNKIFETNRYLTVGGIHAAALLKATLFTRRKGSGKVQVNGTIITLEQKQSLLDFLESKKYDITKIAVERNGEIVPRSAYDKVMLNNEDTLEVVRFVGGG